MRLNTFNQSQTLNSQAFKFGMTKIPLDSDYAGSRKEAKQYFQNIVITLDDWTAENSFYVVDGSSPKVTGLLATNDLNDDDAILLRDKYLCNGGKNLKARGVMILENGKSQLIWKKP